MLAESGPNAMTVRNVATRAGVNHGQVHHYFGGKQGLVNAAAEQLATEHYEHANERAEGRPIPPSLTLSQDSLYLRSFVRMVLDGDPDTATREERLGKSVPAKVRLHLMETFSDKVPVIEIKSRMALTFALELGWAALEPTLMEMVKAQPSELGAIRRRAKQLARKFLDELDELHKPPKLEG